MKTTDVLLSFYQGGEWITKEYKTTDANWREALKLLVESGSQVRINYK
jgi:hypothetical protein